MYSRTSHRTKLRLLQDIFTFLVKRKWQWTLLILACSLAAFFLLFASLYWLVSHAHGDFEAQHNNSSNFIPCIRQIYDFRSCLLFSIETQHTLGYGLRAPTEECPEAIFVNCVQCIFGDIIQGFMTGIIFAKMTLPKKRKETLLFSDKAVICLRDGVRCLMFRVGDVRKNRIIDVDVKVVMLQTKRTREGEVLKLNQTLLKTQVDDCEEYMNFIWPMTVIHKIDRDSPLCNFSFDNVKFKRFEIVAILEGVIESTGQSTQVITSYTANDILWGHKFETILTVDEQNREYDVDFSKFHKTISIPLESVRELEEDGKGGSSVYSVASSRESS